MVQSGWRKWFILREARVQIAALEEAGRELDVIRWRKRHLGREGDPLASWEEVEEWFNQHGGRLVKDGGPGVWRIQAGRSNFGGVSTMTPYLPVAPQTGSPFRSGKVLSENLARRFGWSIPSAGGWLLGGLPPSAEYPVDASQVSGEAHHPWGAVRLVIPFEMPPSAVAELYAEYRDEALADLPLIEGKPIAEKTLRATVHAVRCGLEGHTWDQTHRDWQAIVIRGDAPEDWGFASLHGFISACRKTYRRLTGHGLEWGKRD